MYKTEWAYRNSRFSHDSECISAFDLSVKAQKSVERYGDCHDDESYGYDFILIKFTLDKDWIGDSKLPFKFHIEKVRV